MPNHLNRRTFLAAIPVISPALLAAEAKAEATTTPTKTPPRPTRGIVLYPFDLTLTDWPERCHRAGITTIALHAAIRLDVLIDFVQSDAGQDFLERCNKLDIAVEYELHAMGELLSREYFHKDPTLFRMDETGRRVVDANCNPFSSAALDIIAERAVRIAKILRPTTHRYFYWPDDGAKWDYSPEAKELNASDQALLVENHILRALRREVDPQAMLSHISYHSTLAAPKYVKPEEGIFLEFAPLQRDYTKSIADRDAATSRPNDQHPDPATNGGYLDILKENMVRFGADTTQVLEYWLDVSKFSNWNRPAVKLPWNSEVFQADITAYRAFGVKHISTFATYIDADYLRLHGDPQAQLDEYGKALQ
ncbi:MAG: DUF4838 domain-containing protein [Candidatus Hydrogenedentes bacterium]|nr:DUF4838 domain-containing protein [Candidatus Hydrogenedentota bacterium]